MRGWTTTMRWYRLRVKPTRIEQTETTATVKNITTWKMEFLCGLTQLVVARRSAAGLAAAVTLAVALAYVAKPELSGAAQEKPNIVIILADNLGYGELACYGSVRMVGTPRIDSLAAEGLRLANFNVESWCSPSRSALLTGRFGVRSGTDSLAASGPKGMVQWEVTLAELLSARGYATAHYGKWHLGDQEGRFPTDQGFDEWYGIANSWDEGMITSKPDYIPKEADMPYILEGIKGQKTQEVGIFDVEAGRMIDRELTDKSVAYIQRNAQAKRPFFLYVPIAAVHRPVYSHPDFTDKSGAGLIGDAVMGMDFNVGLILDAIKQAGIEDNTIFIFASDNGPDFGDPWRGTAGPWNGSFKTAMEGSLRTPCIIRWPGRIPAGRVSNEIVHITDLFTTLARAAGAKVPNDRAIDGVDQMDFFTGKQEKSNREGFPVYAYGHLYAVKWHDWKMHFVWRPLATLEPETIRKLFNLRSDPKEEVDVFWQNTWTQAPIEKIATDFEATLAKYPLIAPGTPDPYRLPKK